MAVLKRVVAGMSRVMVVVMMSLAVSVRAQSPVGPEPVPVDREPRHHVVLTTPALRVLEVDIAGNDTTLEHRHDFDMATVNVENGPTRTRDRGAEWGGVRPRAVGGVNFNEYTGKSSAHVVQTVSDRAYRLAGVENLRAGNWTQRPPIGGEHLTVTGESRAFRAYELRLPAASSVTHTHAVPVLITLVEGGAAVTAADRTGTLRTPGQWQLVDEGQTHGVASEFGAFLVEVEVR